MVLGLSSSLGKGAYPSWADLDAMDLRIFVFLEDRLSFTVAHRHDTVVSGLSRYGTDLPYAISLGEEQNPYALKSTAGIRITPSYLPTPRQPPTLNAIISTTI